MNQNLYALFESRFPANRDLPAIHGQGALRYTWNDIDRVTARFARLFIDAGAKPGDRVASQVEKSIEALMVYLACLRAGLVYLPLNSAYQEGEMRYFLGNAEPAVVIGRKAAMPWLQPLATELKVPAVFTLEDDHTGTLLDSALNLPQSFATVTRAADDLACIVYTSGTTGRSKGAMISHRNLSSNASALHQAWGFRPDDVLLHVLPLFHVHGLFVACHTSLVNGTPMIFHNKFDVHAVIADLARATVFMGVPTHYVRLLGENSFGANACRNVRLFVSGSAPLLAETFNEFKQRTGHTILERYGMTETGMLTSNPLRGERRGGTVGKPLPGVTLRIAGANDQPCAAGEIGDIQVKGENVLSGYWRMPEKNAEEFTPDGFFKTGDVGQISADGYVTIVGRSKDLVISGGYNVYPKEIELLIDELDGVAESAVIGVAHPDFGEGVTAVIVMQPGKHQALDEAKLIAYLKSRLASYKVPKRAFFVSDLPRNAMGKVQKNVLRDQHAGIYSR